MSKSRSSILAWSRVGDLKRLAERTSLEHDLTCRCSLCNEASWEVTPPKKVRIVLRRNRRRILIVNISCPRA
jgi:hypothetical protein